MSATSIEGGSFAAYEVISGVRTLPTLVTIVPSQRLLAAFREDDVQRFLHLLAERIGRMEVASRDIRNLLLTSAGLAQDGNDGNLCPCCGQVLP